MRSLLLRCTARETDSGTNDRVIDAFAPFEGLALRHIEDDRSSCSIGVLVAFNDGAAQTPSERPFGHAPSLVNIQKVEKMVGDKRVMHLLINLYRSFYAISR